MIAINEQPLDQALIQTSFGPVHLFASERGITKVSFVDYSRRINIPKHAPLSPPLALGVRALEAYDAGDVEALSLAPLELNGTPFQLQVWALLRSIPPGKTLTYGEIAARTGKSKAAQAVGAACRRNPIALFVPCHRVIGRDGALTGYYGGLERKAKLLKHEAKFTRNQLTAHQGVTARDIDAVDWG